MTITIQVKVMSYYNKYLDDDLISLILKILGCFIFVSALRAQL